MELFKSQILNRNYRSRNSLQQRRNLLSLISIRSFNTKRSPIRKVRFAPGKGNFRAFILFNDGVDIWDIRDVRLSLEKNLLQ